MPKFSTSCQRYQHCIYTLFVIYMLPASHSCMKTKKQFKRYWKNLWPYPYILLAYIYASNKRGKEFHAISTELIFLYWDLLFFNTHTLSQFCFNMQSFLLFTIFSTMHMVLLLICIFLSPNVLGIYSKIWGWEVSPLPYYLLYDFQILHVTNRISPCQDTNLMMGEAACIFSHRYISLEELMLNTYHISPRWYKTQSPKCWHFISYHHYSKYDVKEQL